MLYTSVLLQMHSKLEAVGRVPGSGAQARAWRRSYLLGYATAVIARVRAREKAAVDESKAGDADRGTSTDLVLADRSLAVRRNLVREYPHTRRVQVTYTGGGYAQGRAAGQGADIGGTAVGRRAAGAIR